MKRLLIGTFIGLVIGVTVWYGISAYSQPKSATVAPSEPTIAQLLTLVNAERAKNGVAPLKEDARLNASAQMKANDEVAYNYFGHFRDGKPGTDYIKTVGIACTVRSENLHWAAVNILTASETVDGWINSPAHHAAMINPNYSLTGFGINGKQIVEHFCQQ